MEFGWMPVSLWGFAMVVCALMVWREIAPVVHRAFHPEVQSAESHIMIEVVEVGGEVGWYGNTPIYQNVGVIVWDDRHQAHPLVLDYDGIVPPGTSPDRVHDPEPESSGLAKIVAVLGGVRYVGRFPKGWVRSTHTTNRS